MNPMFDAFIRSWPFEPWLVFWLLVTAAIYLRGWLVLHRRDASRWSRSRLAALLAGLTVLFLALASPIEPFAALLLQAHMLQHLLLMMVVPPLFWLGAPFFPLLRGLPQPIRVYWIAPVLRWSLLRRLFEQLTHPVPALLLFTAATWIWHLPPVYELAMASDRWHYLQHICFLGTAFLFWYPVVRPYPSRPRWSPWLLVPYLIFADLANTLLAAVLTFSSQPLYAHYLRQPRLGNLSPLDDQAAAGVLMWVPGSAAFLVPLFVIGIQLLFGAFETTNRRRGLRRGPQPVPRAVASRIELPVLGQPPLPTRAAALDGLRIPVLGRFLRWKHARLSLQVPLLFLAGVIIYDGLTGPQLGAINLAGVLPWIHWRGVIIVAMLAMGNVFCMACPFVLPRTLARRWLPQGRNWPLWLRNKWLAVGLLALFLWAYEAFALWDSPWWTAWLVVAYFAAAFVVDCVFRGAAFCKYVCPIGQFNFVQSLVSPWEVTVRDANVCSECRTRDCIRGRDGIPGCELDLFQPRKASNMDCTVCLDCIHACPHDNVGILAGPPARELWHDSLRSGLGRFSKRPDLAAIVVLLVFGAFLNAAGMVAPVLEWRDQMTLRLGQRSPLLVTSLIYIVGLFVLPGLCVGGAALFSRWSGRLGMSALEVATRFSYALVPLGFSMWLAHYSFHFLASFDAVAPAAQRFARDAGWAILGEPQWVRACCRPVADWLPRLEIVALDLGLLLSLYSGYRIALSQSQGGSQVLKVLTPWALLIVVLFAAGVWIVLQPMQMRGTLTVAG
jgi:cytochrome c oxidase assembly factor CtaG/polyferredoxin